MSDGPAAAPRRGVKSLGAGLKVLEALAAQLGSAPLGEVAAAAGLSPSQTHRHLVSLIAAGFARQDPSTARYDLADAALALGLAALARLDVVAEAERALAQAVAATGWTGLVAVAGPAGPTIVRWLPGRPAVHTTLTLGSVLDPERSATGRALSSRGAIDAPIAEAALIPGLRAFSAPARDLQGRAAAALTLIADQRRPCDSDAETAAALAAAAAAVTRALGGSR